MCCPHRPGGAGGCWGCISCNFICFATLFCVCRDVKKSWEALLDIDSIHYVIDSHPPLHETDTVSNQPPLPTIWQMSKLSPGAQTSGPRACGQAQICTLALPLTLPWVQPTPSPLCAAPPRMAQLIIWSSLHFLRSMRKEQLSPQLYKGSRDPTAPAHSS